MNQDAEAWWRIPLTIAAVGFVLFVIYAANQKE